MKTKRLLALTLAAAMATGSSMIALAADQNGSGEGSGEVQYVETNDVFSVVLPTTSGTTFDYLLDPDGLIDKTDGDRYSGKVFDDNKTVYFLHQNKVDGTVDGTAGTGNCDYTDTSDAMTVTNKSTQAIDLTVTAKIAAADGVEMDTDGTFTGDGNLYLALVGNDGTTDTTKALTTTGVELTASIEADSAAYEVKWDSTSGKYVRSLTTAAQAADYAGFKSYTFKLTGACKAGDTALTALKENPPKVELTWSVKDFTLTDAAPSIATRAYTLSDATQPLEIPVSLGGGTLAAENVVAVNWKEGGNYAMLASGSALPATYADGKVTITANAVKAFLDDASALPATIVVVFDDAANTTVEVSLTK